MRAMSTISSFGTAALFLMFADPVAAQETSPGKPFLEKNAFYLSSAGFRPKFANDAAGQKALRAMPAHRFVIHTVDGKTRYLYADPKGCVCIFVGSKDNYESYRSIVAQPLGPAPDDVAADYKTNAQTMLNDPLGSGSIYEPDTLADYLQDYY
ncbi:hypothetical protein ASC80_12980 [Afipia sp. Root123D2]|uniref:hypothetical protein n=1 Tax=Afipia sp. Root123D2 TaxID=1736436 RepID=UPI000700AF83|nr:hypothetical protein [Afipia sp. Root123D2]KQW21053.1 hypothetical protein ASC80_12980 [Afipia sp. Root123D2]